MLAFTLSLLSPAHAFGSADIAMEPCEPDMLTEIRPVEGQVDVPLDARLIAVVDVGGCGSSTVNWNLFQGEPSESDGVPVEQGVASVDWSSHLAPITPAELLAPETAYTLVVLYDSGTDVVHFTTGTELVGEITDSPEAIIRDLQVTTGFREATTWQAEIDLLFTPSEHGLSVLRAYDTRYPQTPIATAFADSSGEKAWSLEWWDENTDEACLVFTQEDEAGREGARSAPLCEVPDHLRAGCSTSGGSTGGWALLALTGLVGLGRRRRVGMAS